MATFVMLVSFTDQGVRNIKETTKRADSFKQMAEKVGVTVRDIYWTLGQYDAVAIGEAPDDETATAVALSIGSLGNIRTQTLPAFSRNEMDAIIKKMA
jgi:uncharacterized protein with GYD domain